MESYVFSLAVAMYLLSFVLHSVSASFGKDSLYRYGRWSCLLGAGSATAALLFRWSYAGHPPLSNMYESLATLSTMIAWASIMFTHKLPIPLLEGGSAVMALLFIGIASLFSGEVRPLIPALQSYWLHVHVSLAFMGEACLALAFVMSYLFCLRRILEGREVESEPGALPPATPLERMLCTAMVILLPVSFLGLMTFIAMKYFDSGLYAHGYKAVLLVGGPVFLILCFVFGMLYLFRGAVGTVAHKWLPSAEILDQLTYRAIALGYPLFTVGAIIFGMVWANQAWGRYWGWDPKETWSLITFLVYSIYLHVRLTRGWRGTGMAFLSIIGFLVTMFTLFGVNLLLSGLHSYG